MCFTINKYNPKALTSDHDIPCFKILLLHIKSGLPWSPTRNYRYTIGEIQNIVRLIPEDILSYHSERPSIQRGYHSYISLDRLKRSSFYQSMIRPIEVYKIVIGECVIPQGYDYYVNYETGEYVSESIIVKRIYESNESSSDRPSEK